MNSNPCFGPRKSLLFNLFLPSSKLKAFVHVHLQNQGSLFLLLLLLGLDLISFSTYSPSTALLSGAQNGMFLTKPTFFFSFQRSASSRDIEAGNPMISINLFIILYMAGGIRNLADVDASLFHLRAWFSEYR